jgi:hypothetical protein
LIRREKIMLFGTRLAALILAALSLGPSFAHLLERPPRMAWPPELWMATTNFGAQYAWFGRVGAILDPATILVLLLLAWLTRRRQSVFVAAAASFLLFGAALACWALVVQPMNVVMAGWTPGSVPADFEAVRARWEEGHVVVAALKLAGLVALAFAVLPGRDRRGFR